MIDIEAIKAHVKEYNTDFMEELGMNKCSVYCVRFAEYIPVLIMEIERLSKELENKELVMELHRSASLEITDTAFATIHIKEQLKEALLHIATTPNQFVKCYYCQKNEACDHRHRRTESCCESFVLTNELE